jgi:hypothetical protein
LKKYLIIPFILFLVLSDVCIEKNPNYSGHYYVTLGPNPVYTMDIDHAVDDTYATFVLKGWGIDISGTGSIEDNSMELIADIPNFGTITLIAEFSEDEQDFSGSWFFTGVLPLKGTVTGTKSSWPPFDVNTNPLPLMGTHNCIELHKIRAISKFRSGEGHDYSDDFEDCRSMKHYYMTKNSVDMSLVKIFSPVSGTVVGTTDEYDDDGILWKGTSVGIQPDGYESFCFVIYHINLNMSLMVGDRVTSGQELGCSEKKTGTVTDIALWVHTPEGNKLVSFFEVISDPVFQLYFNRGLPSRNQAIITKIERDLDLLECIGEQFVNPGNLENWFDFN